MAYIADHTNLFATLESMVTSHGVPAILDALARIAWDNARKLRASHGRSDACKAWERNASYLDMAADNIRITEDL